MIYIQSNSERTMAHHFDCACALYGAIDSGLDYRLTSFEEVSSGKFDQLLKSRLFVGSTEFMTEVFGRMGFYNVKLPANSNRACEIITLKEAHNRVSNGETLFVKPTHIKLFSGLILNGMIQSCLTSLPEDTLVMAYQPFSSPIKSEWRTYVHNNKIFDCRNYSGDFTIHPDYAYINDVIKSNVKTFPCAYTIDIGILENGDNVVVEYNDMWAIGNYGVENDRYLRMLTDRYFQIVRG